ncbi:unnamed protein product [Staurois parvus]|uniref:Uncharacterized protein n=1 Tax=Staurois parvus TaxID=386267 RepID=A0ABN9FMD1_9NEOB|nr:unnamed protein product [Staurois parvus]
MILLQAESRRHLGARLIGVYNHDALPMSLLPLISASKRPHVTQQRGRGMG